MNPAPFCLHVTSILLVSVVVFVPSMYLVPLGQSEFDCFLATAIFKIELLFSFYPDITLARLGNGYSLPVLHAIAHVHSVLLDISSCPAVSVPSVRLETAHIGCTLLPFTLTESVNNKINCIYEARIEAVRAVLKVTEDFWELTV